jgi:hypothetical protein
VLRPTTVEAVLEDDETAVLAALEVLGLSDGTLVIPHGVLPLNQWGWSS